MSDEHNKAFGQRLRQARKAAGLKTEELGEKVFYGKWAIESYERGMRLPPIETVCKMAEVLGVSVNWLTEGRGEGP